MKNLGRYSIAAILCLALAMASIASCSSCREEDEPAGVVVSKPVVIEGGAFDDSDKVAEKDKNIKRIVIKGRDSGVNESAETGGEADKEAPPKEKVSAVALPPDTYEETDLSNRLREKMLDAYDGKEEAVPDVKIYISDMPYDQFVKYYQSLGYDVETVAVPATQVIEPVLEQRPELAGKINLSDYEGIVIHQVMINEAGISASDKYIDPDTFEVVEKTFVTKMNR